MMADQAFESAHSLVAKWRYVLMGLQAYGIIGCVRFLESFYLLLVTKKEQQGSICGHKVYSVADTALIPLVQPAGLVRTFSTSNIALVAQRVAEGRKEHPEENPFSQSKHRPEI